MDSKAFLEHFTKENGRLAYTGDDIWDLQQALLQQGKGFSEEDIAMALVKSQGLSAMDIEIMSEYLIDICRTKQSIILNSDDIEFLLLCVRDHTHKQFTIDHIKGALSELSFSPHLGSANWLEFLKTEF